jgi:(p)ppGpp synthase/HD superfamily hydrolase
MSCLAKAIAIAARAHEHQRDKAGAPYILHPLRMMFRMGTEEEKVVAVLHDLLEDAEDWTAGRLRAEGFSDEIVAALECLTKRDGEEYGAFIARAAANPLSLKVKLADLEDNMDPTRLETLGPKEVERLQKYHRAYRELSRKDGTSPPSAAPPRQ